MNLWPFNLTLALDPTDFAFNMQYFPKMSPIVMEEKGIARTMETKNVYISSILRLSVCIVITDSE